MHLSRAAASSLRNKSSPSSRLLQGITSNFEKRFKELHHVPTKRQSKSGHQLSPEMFTRKPRIPGATTLLCMSTSKTRRWIGSTQRSRKPSPAKPELKQQGGRGYLLQDATSTSEILHSMRRRTLGPRRYPTKTIDFPIRHGGYLQEMVVTYKKMSLGALATLHWEPTRGVL